MTVIVKPLLLFICMSYIRRRWPIKKTLAYQEDVGLSRRRWPIKKTLAYLLVLPGSRARIVRWGGRYDPQLVKRSSEEWVSGRRFLRDLTGGCIVLCASRTISTSAQSGRTVQIPCVLQLSSQLRARAEISPAWEPWTRRTVVTREQNTIALQTAANEPRFYTAPARTTGMQNSS